MIPKSACKQQGRRKDARGWSPGETSQKPECISTYSAIVTSGRTLMCVLISVQTNIEKCVTQAWWFTTFIRVAIVRWLIAVTALPFILAPNA
jgi:hypothetical protein